eukprot:scaffold126648_cov31-Tisochrysis_lutea.AAC.4
MVCACDDAAPADALVSEEDFPPVAVVLRVAGEYASLSVIIAAKDSACLAIWARARCLAAIFLARRSTSAASSAFADLSSVAPALDVDDTNEADC